MTLDWVLDELFTITDERVGPDDLLFEDELLDSMGLVTLLTVIEETYGIDFDLRGVDRDVWRTARIVAEDIDHALA